MMDFKVDEAKCIGCGSCVRDCVSGAIEMCGSVPTVARFGERMCIKCQHCLAVCPRGAISIFGIKPESCGTVKTLPRPDDVASLLKFRRSCRQFKPENVSKDKVAKLKDVLNWAPTGCNSRAMHFAIVEDVKAMGRLRLLLNKTLLSAIQNDTLPPSMSGMKLAAPLLERGDDLVLRGAPHLIVAAAHRDAPSGTIDPVIALAQFEVMAQSLGLGTTWCGFAHLVIGNLCSDAKALLNLPEGFSPSCLMLFGEPAVVYPRTTCPEPYGISVIS